MLVKLEIKQQRSHRQRLASLQQDIFDHGISGVREVTRKSNLNIKLQQVDLECPIGLKWVWKDRISIEDRTEDKSRMLVWAAETKSNIEGQYIVNITDDGLEIRVHLLTDMPDMIK